MAGFWSGPLVIAVAINVFVTALQIGAYAGRIAGVRTGRVGTSISLFNLFTLASRLANLFVTPALGSLADAAAERSACAHGGVPPEFAWQMRAIIAAGTLGAVVGTLFLPTFITLFMRGVYAFEKRGSLLRAVLRLADPRVLADVARSVRLPPVARVRELLAMRPPLSLILGNVVLTGVYGAGVNAAFFASVLDLDARTTATGLSGLVNGVGTIAFSFFVDPKTAFITDQAVKGERPVDDVRGMVVWLCLSAVAGWALSQLILVPGAIFIGFGAHLFHHGTPVVCNPRAV